MAMFRSKPTKDSLTVPLFDVNISFSDTARVDKYRANNNNLTSLFLATLKDGGNPIDVVAKVERSRVLNF